MTGRRLLLIGLLGLVVGVPVQRLVVLADLVVALQLDLAGRQLLELGGRLRPVALLGLRLDVGGQRDQRARQRVHLVRRERGAVARALVRESRLGELFRPALSR